MTANGTAMHATSPEPNPNGPAADDAGDNGLRYIIGWPAVPECRAVSRVRGSIIQEQFRVPEWLSYTGRHCNNQQNYVQRQ